MTDNGEFAPMISYDYRQRLLYWAVVQHLPNLKHKVLARFHRRADADGHLKILQKTLPDGEFEVLFDLIEE